MNRAARFRTARVFQGMYMPGSTCRFRFNPYAYLYRSIPFFFIHSGISSPFKP